MQHSICTKGRLRAILASVVVFSMLTLQLPTPPPAHAFSLSDEKELGRKLLGKIRESMPLVEDGDILTYVQSVGSRIVAQLGTTPYQYRFFVVDEPVPNAFAVPGGYIFIYRGLIEMMESEGELASILSHELAHIQAQHLNRRMQEGRILSVAALASILAGALLGMKSDLSQAMAVGGMAGAQSLGLKYSRENEEEADQLGFRYLCAAGYPPQAMAGVMKKMSQTKWVSSSRVPTYLMTHPALIERVQYLETLVQKERGQAKKRASDGIEGDFGLMKAALVAQYTDPAVALDRLQADAKKGQTAAVYGMGRLLLREGKLAEALPCLQRAAGQASGSPFVLSTLGSAYLEQGRVSEAQKVFQTALLLDPSLSIVHLRLASLLIDRGEREEALRHLIQIEGLAPAFPEIDYKLGVVYGQLNQLGSAHFHLARYSEQKRDWEAAKFHYEKAKALVTGDPQKREEIDEALKEIKEHKREAMMEKQQQQQQRRFAPLRVLPR